MKVYQVIYLRERNREQESDALAGWRIILGGLILCAFTLLLALAAYRVPMP